MVVWAGRVLEPLSRPLSVHSADVVPPTEQTTVPYLAEISILVSCILAGGE